MSGTISKEELKRADQLTIAGQQAFDHLVRNQRLVFAAGLILFLGGAGYVAWDKLALNKELTVQEQYYSIEKSYLKTKEGFDKAEAEQKQKENAKKDPAKEDKSAAAEKTPEAKLPTGDLAKDYGTTVEGWKQLIEASPNSKAGAMAALELSELYLKYHQPKEALQVLSKVKAQQNSDQFLGAMVFHTYAKLLANQGQCQEAVSVWENLEKKKKLAFLTEQAQMGQALCLESLGQMEKAETLWKALAAGKPEASGKPVQPTTKSQVQKNAEKYLRYLKLKKSMGAQAPS